MDNVSTSYDLEVSYIYEENHLPNDASTKF